jgi:hypothetical protein
VEIGAQSDGWLTCCSDAAIALDCTHLVYWRGLHRMNYYTALSTSL